MIFFHNGYGLLLSLSIILGSICTIETSLAQTRNQQHSNNFSELSPTEQQTEVQTITNLLNRQADSWNAGKLESFMGAYWKSEQLTFSASGGTTRGWQATLDRYKQGYAPPKEMGKLKFSGLETTIFENKTALVLGNWHLAFSDNKTREGNFSLVMYKRDGKWMIIHDHSSEKKPEELKPDAKSGKDAPAASAEGDKK